MSGVEIGLAVVATVDLCFKHGSNLVRICKSVKNADVEITERVLCIESYWKRTEIQLGFLQRVWSALDTEHQAIQTQILQVLISKLSVAISKIDGMINPETSTVLSSSGQYQIPSRISKWRYAFLRERLDETIQDMKTWQTMFDPTWFLMLLTSNSQLDTALDQQEGASSSPAMLNNTKALRDNLRGLSTPTSSVFLPEDELNSARIINLPFSSAKIAQRAGSNKLLVLDSLNSMNQGNPQRLLTDVRDLAQKLSRTEPIEFGLLKCRGVVRRHAISLTAGQCISFTLIFKTVEGFLPPQSLRACLLAQQHIHSLSDRLSVARDLAKSVSFVHTFGFVHKGVRPENILLCTKDSSLLGHSFLVGFEDFRNAEGQTTKTGDVAWNKNLYRHPGRQGLRPDDCFVMQHDIYSLGVCLLEIGLWESFVLYDEASSALPAPMFNSALTQVASWDPAPVKAALLFLTRNLLPSRIGSKYAKVVETCLTCLDKDNADFGDEREFQDSDGILVGVRYIEKVLLQLDGISI